MGISPITNVGSLTALSALRGINSRLDVASKKLETGYRVADAFDDGGVFAVAQNIRGSLKAHAAVESSLQQGISLVDVTLAALHAVSNVTVDLRGTLIKASDGSLDEEQRQIYKSDAKALHQHILFIARNANFNGKNQMLDTSTDTSFVKDIYGSMITVGVYGMNPAWNDLGTAIDAITDGTTARDAYELIDPLDTQTIDASNRFSQSRREFETQIEFNAHLFDAVKSGLNVLIDIDVADTQVSQQSLLVKQQLAYSALSIANNNPSILLPLLRA